MEGGTVEVSVLGPVRITVAGRPLALASRKQRALIACLALEAPQTVALEHLIDALWGDAPPPTAKNTLEAYVSRTRKALRDAGAPDGILVTEGAGYSLRGVTTDLQRFEELRAAGARRTRDGHRADRAEVLNRALALWRGEPIADIAEPFAARERERLEQLRLHATLERIDANLEQGRHAEVIVELKTLIRAHPYQERPRAQLMLALYREGRQADALDLYRETHRLFRDELGLEPSPELQKLEQAILRHDPQLAAPTPAAAPVLVQPSDDAAAETPQARRRGLRLALGTLAVAIGAAAAIGYVSTQTSTPYAPKHPEALGKRLLASIPVSLPSCCAFSPGAVWAVGHHDRTLYEIDLRRNRVIGRYPVAGFQAEAPLDAAGSIWIPSVGSRVLVRFDPTRKKVVSRIPLEGGQIDFGYLSIWVTTRNHQLDRVNLRTNKIVSRISLAPGYNDFDDDVGIGFGSVWCTVTDASTLVRVDPATNSVTARITGFGDTESWMPLAIGDGSVWVARVTGDYEVLYRIDPTTNQIVARIRVGHRGAAWPNGFITVAAGYVWTGNWDATVSQVDARTNKVVGWYRIPEHPEELAYGFGSLWVAYYDLSKIQRIAPDV